MWRCVTFGFTFLLKLLFCRALNIIVFVCFCPQIREVWNSYELDLVNYQNKCRLIRGWDDLFNKVKEHINSVSAMKLSPYYKVHRIVS